LLETTATTPIRATTVCVTTAEVKEGMAQVRARGKGTGPKTSGKRAWSEALQDQGIDVAKGSGLDT